MSEQNWWDDRTMPNDDGPDWERDADGVLWQVDPRTGRRTRCTPASTIAELQTWERRLGGTDIAEVRIHLEVDDQGRVRLHEALAARLLHEAGWERTA